MVILITIIGQLHLMTPFLLVPMHTLGIVDNRSGLWTFRPTFWCHRSSSDAGEKQKIIETHRRSRRESHSPLLLLLPGINNLYWNFQYYVNTRLVPVANEAFSSRFAFSFISLAFWENEKKNVSICSNSGCSTAVEHTPHNQEVLSLYPAYYWAFSSILSYSPSAVEFP